MGKIARITNDGQLLIKGELIEQDIITNSYGFLEQNGLLVIEAEHYHDKTSEFFVVESDLDASNGECLYIVDGSGNGVGESTYDISIENDGVYNVWVRQWSNSSDNDSYYFRMYNSTGSRIINSAHYGSSGGVWSWNLISASPVTLGKGSYIVGLANREDGMRFDKIVITSDLDYVPTGIEFDESSLKNDYKIRFDANGNLICKDYIEVFGSIFRLSNGVINLNSIIENYDLSFKPLQMEGVQAYFDASVLDVASVPTWEDLSGNNNNLVASSTSPTVINNALNGLNTLAFDATPMTFPATFKLAPNASVYMIVKSNSAGGTLQSIMGSQGITAVTAPRFYIAYHGAYLMRTQGSQTSSGVTIQDDFVIYSMRHDELGNMELIVNDNVVEVSGHITQYNDEVVQFGFGSYRGFKGEVGELIIFNRMLNDKEHNALYGYLREKWGV